MAQLNCFFLLGTFILFSCRIGKNDLKANVDLKTTNIEQIEEVLICNQVWMNINLNVSFFRNNDSIPEAKTDAEWHKAGQEKRPAWCHYNNDPRMGKIYGKLYNWYAVIDSRGLAPLGWHIPTEQEWWTLRNCIKEPFNEHSEKLKSTTNDWYLDHGKSGKGNDSTGFTALPAGQRSTGVESSFMDLGFSSNFWTSTKKSYGAYYVSISDIGNQIYGNPTYFESGMSVRCIKD